MTRLQHFLWVTILAGAASAHAGSLLPAASAVHAMRAGTLLGIINVPEPGTWVLMGSALLVVFGLSRRKVQKAAQISRQSEIGLRRDVQ